MFSILIKCHSSSTDTINISFHSTKLVTCMSLSHARKNSSITLKFRCNDWDASNSHICNKASIFTSTPTPEIILIRPHLEYLPRIWNPSFKGDIDIIESVQNYALWVCTKSWELSYDDLLSIPPLHKRRLIVCLSHLYKILNGLTGFPDAPVEPKNFSYNSRSADSTYLCVPNFRTSSHQHSFFPKTITA